MTCRLSRVWIFALALLGPLTLTAHLNAKPPDLPVDPNNEVAPIAAPPLPGYQQQPAGYLGYYPPDMPAPETAPTPETITIYHPVRPSVPLSVQQTLDQCLLFAVHPLLSLLPVSDWIEEEHTQEIVPAPRLMHTIGPDGVERIGVDFNSTAPVPCPAPETGSLLFGVGVNSDAGLSGDIAINERNFDVPAPEGVSKLWTGGCLPFPCELPGLQTVCATTLGAWTRTLVLAPEGNFYLLEYGPADDGYHLLSIKPMDLSTEKREQPTASACPWKNGSTREHSASASADAEMAPSVLQNLDSLAEAEKLCQQANKLVSSGKYGDALNCLSLACIICPGSRFEEMSADLVAKIVCRVCSPSDVEADTEESEDVPPTQCLPNWSDDEELREPSSESMNKHIAPETLVRKVYCVGDILAWSKTGPDDLISFIANAIDPAPRLVVAPKGMFDYFPVSQVLVVNQCAEVQKEIAYLLDTMRCQEAKDAGIEEQVTGLMKACHLALGDGCYQKAADLAREAYALDAERVAADPVVYKMHLLALKGDHCPACCEDCEHKDCCCPAKQALPPLPTVTQNLQKLLIKDATAAAKPYLEVVEEESEVREVPKASDKPFCLRSAQTGDVFSCDDLLRFVPGETWTELDATTNHLRVLWRVRVGDKTFCIRYDGGDVSLGCTTMP